MPSPPPYSAQWTATTGSWGDAADWLEYDPSTSQPEHYVPGADNAVTISNNGSSGYTITYDLDSTIWSLNSGSVVTLDIAGGSLTVDYGGVVGGTLDLAAGATLSEAAGSTLVLWSGAISGTLAGGGDIEFQYGAEAIDTTTITVATWELGVSGNGTGSVTTLDDSLSYADDFLLDDVSGNNAVLDLNGQTLTLTGSATLNGAVNGPGTLYVEGTATELGYYVVSGGADAVETSGATITQQGDTTLGGGGGTGTLTIDAGANYNITATSSLGDTDPADATIADSGTMTVSEDSVATILGGLTVSGTLTVDLGSIAYLDGGSFLATGAVGGPGVLQLGDGEAAGFDTSNVTVGEILITGGNGGGTTTLDKGLTYGGAFDFESEFGDLDLNGKFLTLTGSSNNLISGDIVGGGTIVVKGDANIAVAIGGNGAAADLTDDGSIDQVGNVSLNGKLTISAGDFYTIEDASSIVDEGATIVVGGTLADASSGGTSYASGAITVNGTLTVAANDTFDIYGTDTLKGKLSGAGALEFGYGAQVSVDTSTMSVDELIIYGGNGGGTTTFDDSLTYGGVFDFDNGFGTLDIAAGKTLTLSGSTNYLYGGNIGGGGTIVVTGSADLTSSIGGGGSATDIVDKGSIDQVGNVSLNGKLTVDTGEIYTLTAATSLNNDGATIVNDGTFSDASTGGTSYVSATFTSTGTVTVAAPDTLDLEGTETLKGTL